VWLKVIKERGSKSTCSVSPVSLFLHPRLRAGPGSQIAGEGQVYEVKPGDTLGAIAQRFYGKAGLYPKIFEANNDILVNPDLIKVGQKLKIPKL
jgi:nucleoid-associated protein YgaU